MYRAITMKEHKALYKLAQEFDSDVEEYNQDYGELEFRPVSTDKANKITKALSNYI